MRRRRRRIPRGRGARAEQSSPGRGRKGRKCALPYTSRQVHVLHAYGLLLSLTTTTTWQKEGPGRVYAWKRVAAATRPSDAFGTVGSPFVCLCLLSTQVWRREKRLSVGSRLTVLGTQKRDVKYFCAASRKSGQREVHPVGSSRGNGRSLEGGLASGGATNLPGVLKTNVRPALVLPLSFLSSFGQLSF